MESWMKKDNVPWQGTTDITASVFAALERLVKEDALTCVIQYVSVSGVNDEVLNVWIRAGTIWAGLDYDMDRDVIMSIPQDRSKYHIYWNINSIPAHERDGRGEIGEMTVYDILKRALCT